MKPLLRIATEYKRFDFWLEPPYFTTGVAMPGRNSVPRTDPKAPSIYDVAREARVSVFTVSAVINNKGRVSATLGRRVEAAIRKLSYRPNLLARSLAKQQTHTIGMVVTDIVNPFFPAIVRAAEDAAQKAGYSVLLCNSDDKQDKEALYLELLISKRVDGIILNKTPGSLSAAQRTMLSNSNVPIVLLMRTCPGLKADLVQTDDQLGAYYAVEHLARVGHKRIALVGGPAHVSNARARQKGYLKALQAAELHFDPKLVFEGDYRVDSGHRAGFNSLATPAGRSPGYELPDDGRLHERSRRNWYVLPGRFRAGEFRRLPLARLLSSSPHHD